MGAYGQPTTGASPEQEGDECEPGMYKNAAGLCVPCGEGMSWDPWSRRCVETQSTPDTVSIPDPVRENQENKHINGFLSKNKLVIEQISKAFSNKSINIPRKKLEEVIRKQIMSNLKQGAKE